MKLLMISTDRSIFEEDSAVRERLIEQAALVSELHVVVFTLPGEQFKKFSIGELHVYPSMSSHKLTYLPDAYEAAKRLLRRKSKHALKEEGWLVTTQDPFETGILGYLVARKFHLPLHLQLHTDPFSRAWQSEKFLNRIRYTIMLFLLHHASGIRVVSERVYRAVCASGVRKERITRVPIFVDVEKFQKAKPSFDLHQSYPEFLQIILSIGRLQPEKNYHGLIRAFARVARTHPDALLLIVGSGPLRERLLVLARSLNLHHQLRILPWARDVASYYKTCDLYVQPSLYEGWGLAVIEAMASSAPVVMTNVGCAGELIRDGETGLVAPTGNDGELANAISRMLDDNTLRATILGNAKEEVKKLATKEVTLGLYKTSWEKALVEFTCKTHEKR
jgi:glycosyltransferase involved in cell wall biosynthesis